MKKKGRKIGVEIVQHEVNNPLMVVLAVIEKNRGHLSKKDFTMLEKHIKRISDFTHGLRENI